MPTRNMQKLKALQIKSLAEAIKELHSTKQYRPSDEVLTQISALAGKRITQNRFTRITGMNGTISANVTISEFVSVAKYYGLNPFDFVTTPANAAPAAIKNKLKRFA